MGADIHSFTEIKKNGKWTRVMSDESINDSIINPFNWRSYGMFGFLANVRNYSKITPICETRGLPIDSEWLNAPSEYAYEINPMNGEAIPIEERETNRQYIYYGCYHSYSFITLAELIDFDYSKDFEDLRISNIPFTVTTDPGKGIIVSYRDFLGESYFTEIETLKTLGDASDVRIVFWFDN